MESSSDGDWILIEQLTIKNVVHKILFKAIKDKWG